MRAGCWFLDHHLFELAKPQWPATKLAAHFGCVTGPRAVGATKEYIRSVPEFRGWAINYSDPDRDAHDSDDAVSLPLRSCARSGSRQDPDLEHAAGAVDARAEKQLQRMRVVVPGKITDHPKCRIEATSRPASGDRTRAVLTVSFQD